MRPQPSYQLSDRCSSPDAGQLELVTSVVTLPEVLVVPHWANDDALAARYDTLLTRSRGIRLLDVTREQLRRRTATRVDR
jgi:hypothetical protein